MKLSASWSLAFLFFGAILVSTAVKVGRDALSQDDPAVDIGSPCARSACCADCGR